MLGLHDNDKTEDKQYQPATWAHAEKCVRASEKVSGHQLFTSNMVCWMMKQYLHACSARRGAAQRGGWPACDAERWIIVSPWLTVDGVADIAYLAVTVGDAQ